jgi:hypothetical protein
MGSYFTFVGNQYRLEKIFGHVVTMLQSLLMKKPGLQHEVICE